MFIAKMIFAAISILVASAVGAQGLPPIPGSTTEFQNGSLLVQQNKKDEGYALMLSACDKGDAAGCYDLVELRRYDSKKFLQLRPGISDTQIAQKTTLLLRQRCTLTQDSGSACELYRIFLSNYPNYPDLRLEGGRLLAARCLGGRMGVEDCEDIEEYIQSAGQVERDKLVAWVDKTYAEICAAKMVNGCVRALFRMRYGSRSYPEERIHARFNTVGEACNAGQPNICAEYSRAVYQIFGKAALPNAAAAMGMACRFPPSTGEQDIKQIACDAELKLRQQIAEGS